MEQEKQVNHFEKIKLPISHRIKTGINPLANYIIVHGSVDIEQLSTDELVYLLNTKSRLDAANELMRRKEFKPSYMMYTRTNTSECAAYYSNNQECYDNLKFEELAYLCDYGVFSDLLCEFMITHIKSKECGQLNRIAISLGMLSSLLLYRGYRKQIDKVCEVIFDELKTIKSADHWHFLKLLDIYSHCSIFDYVKNRFNLKEHDFKAGFNSMHVIHYILSEIDDIGILCKCLLKSSDLYDQILHKIKKLNPSFEELDNAGFFKASVGIANALKVVEESVHLY